MVIAKYAPLVRLMHRGTESGEFMQLGDITDSRGLEANGTSLYRTAECSSFFSRIYQISCSLESVLVLALGGRGISSTEQARLGL